MSDGEGEGDSGRFGDLEPFLREAPALVETLAINVEALGGAGATAALDSLALLTHRLSGSASLYGLVEFAALAAAMERAVAGLAAGETAGAGEGRGVLRDAVAALGRALAAAGEGQADAGEGITDDLLARLAELAARPPRPPPATADDPRAARLRAAAAANPDILEFFEPEAREQVEGIAVALDRLAREPGARLPVESAFRLAHTLKGAAYMVDCEPIAELAHAMEEVLAPARDGHLELRAPALRALERANDLAQRMLAALTGEAVAITEAEREVHARLTELLAGEPETAGETTGTEDTSPPAPVELPTGGDGRAGGPERTIRVGLERIDLLVDQVGEAMISRGRLEHDLERLAEIEKLYAVSRDRLARAAEEIERRHLSAAPQVADAVTRSADRDPLEFAEIALDGFSELELDRYDELDVLMRQIAEISFDLGEAQHQLIALRRELGDELARSGRMLRGLRETIGRTRMLPLGRLFERFRRRVERLARDHGKSAVLEVAGGQAEVDTVIAQRIGDPLLHLIANALIHGIEEREERLAAGKPEVGTIALRATVRGVFVDLEIEDDGRGLDPVLLRRQAVALGIASEAEAARMSDTAAVEQIFLPGFSTAREVTGAAGRGIGMDVVRTVVGELGGQIRVESLPGQGSRFTLRLPATLVVSTGLRVRVGAEDFVLPTLNIRRLLEVEPARLATRDGREWVRLESDEIEVFRLARQLGLAEDPPGDSVHLALVQTPGRDVAMAVDELVRIEEVVVQALGGFLEGLAGFSGVTIDPDGAVVLVLDPATLPTRPRAALRPLTGIATSGLEGEAADSRPRVLLADDSISVRKILGRQLTAAGYEVVTAHDGEEALRALRESSFAALITDIEMPRLNGFELLDLLRRRPATRSLPAIVITTRSGSKHRDLATRLGVSAYFSKPVDLDALLSDLASITARHRADLAAGQAAPNLEAG